VFERWLDQQADSARVVLVCDTDRLLSDAKALDSPEFTDPSGRKWHLAIFRGDHLRFRLDFRKAIRKGRTVIVLVGSTHPDARVDVSLLSDVLARHEGTPLDLSLAQYLGRFCPQINFPDQPLRHYRERLLAHIPELSGAARKITARWGKPDDWGRPQVAALVLLAHAPSLSLDDVWPEADTPEHFVAHGLQLLLARPELASLREPLRDFLRSAALPAVKEQLHWFEPGVAELAAYLVFRDFAAQHKLQNPTVQLAGTGLLGADFDWSRCEPLALPVITQLRSHGVWPQVEQAAAAYVNPKRVEKLLSLVGADTADTSALVKLTASISAPPVRRNVLQRLLLLVLADPSQLGPVVQALKAPELAGLAGAEPPDAADTVRQVNAGFALLSCWHRVEQTLAQSVPKVAQPNALLTLYQQGGWFRLEADIASLSHFALQFGDDDIIAAVHTLLFGESGHDTRPVPGSLKDRVRAALHRLDEQLAEFIRPSVEAFAGGGWSATSFLRNRLRQRVTELSLGNGEGRVWILVFDGMRFDTWSLVVRTIFAEHFQIAEERALFCVPPSFTTVARASLFAGAAPAGWKGFQGQVTRDEAALVAVNLGLTQPEAKAKLRLIKEAETLKARAKLAREDKDARLLNVLIYGIADDCHEFPHDFGQFHQKISADLTGNRTQGTAGILDDILRRVQPEDEVVLVSDHGFTELLDDDGIPVSAAECSAAGRNPMDAIRWRYVLGFTPAAATKPVVVNVHGEPHCLAVGRSWFQRDGTTSSDRYSHGGISMAEMVVPAVTLKRVTTKLALVVIENLPDRIAVDEDASVSVAICIRNRGNVAVNFAGDGRTNLGDNVLSQSGRIPPGDIRDLTFALLGRYRETAMREIDPSGTLRAVSLRLRHTGLDGSLTEPPDGQLTIPVDVRPKATKLDTDALAGLDNL
jgi:hypothetical protein